MMTPHEIWNVPPTFKVIPILVEYVCENWIELTKGE